MNWMNVLGAAVTGTTDEIRADYPESQESLQIQQEELVKQFDAEMKHLEELVMQCANTGRGLQTFAVLKAIIDMKICPSESMFDMSLAALAQEKEWTKCNELMNLFRTIQG